MLAAVLAAPAVQARALGKALAPVESCEWNHPGANSFQGDIAGAVDHYADIPVGVRERLKQRILEKRHDDYVTITRDAISGKQRYASRISDMHFGGGSVCHSVSRSGWSTQMRQRGPVYCEEGHCILVPNICTNVSRIARIAPPAVAQAKPPAAPLRFVEKDEMGGPEGRAKPEPYSAEESAEATRFAIGVLAQLLPRTQAQQVPVVQAHDAADEEFERSGHTAGSTGRWSAAARQGDFGGGGGGGSGIGPGVMAPVPELAEWLMLLAGLGCIGLAVRRARKARLPP